jgi:iron complex outermembrane recepter protein
VNAYSLKAVACWSGTLAVVLGGDLAHAQVRTFDIPSESASKSIPELARQADVQIIGPGEPLQSIVTPEVKGTFDVVAVLQMMLKATDLTVSRTAEGVIKISFIKKRNVCIDEGETTMNKSQFTRSASMLALALASLQCAVAQTGDSQTVETIVVTGVRASLQTAQTIKRESTQIVDSIVADDIGKLPDRNIAEALQRITGIQVQNNKSEGSSIAIRGLTQVRTELNGRDIFTAGGVNTLNLEYVPSELLAGVDVYKNPSADMIEDQLSGTVNLKTRKPFDFAGSKFSASLSENYYDFAKKLKPSGTLLLSDRMNTSVGEIGAMVSFVFQQTAYRNQQDQTEPYYTLDPTVAADAATLATLGRTGQTTTIPHGGGFNDNWGPRQRIGVDTVLQWRPSDSVEATFEWFHNDFKYTNVGTSFFALPVSDSTSLYNGTMQPLAGAAFTFDDTGTFTSGTWTNVSIGDYHFRNANKSTNDDATLNVKWDVNSHLAVSADLQYGHSDADSAFWLVSYTVSGAGNTFYQDIRGAFAKMHIGLGGGAVTDASLYSNSSFMSSFGTQAGEDKTARADAEYKFDSSFLKSVKVGVRYSRRNNHGASNQFQYVSESGTATDPEVYSTTDFMRGRADVGTGFVAFDHLLMRSFGAASSAFGISAPGDWLTTGNSYVTLKTAAGYAVGFFDTELAGIPIDGNVGVRVVDTTEGASGYYTLTPQIVVSGQQTLGDPITTPISFEQNYLEALPSFNVRAHLSDELQLRFAVSRNLARPTFDQLNPTLTLNEPISTELTNYHTATGGNPYLNPMMSLNFDTSVEWYFNNSGSLSLAGFYKKVEGFVQSGLSERNITFSDGTTVLYHVTSYSNVADATIKGFELGYQQFFDFLPGALKGLGVQANVTFVDSQAPSPAASGSVTTLPLIDLSKWSYNLVAIYELNGLSARFAYNWRSKYLEVPNDSGVGNLPRMDKPYGQLDGSIGYDINEHFAVSLDARNINNALVRTYFGLTNRPRNVEMGDRRIGLTIRATY